MRTRFFWSPPVAWQAMLILAFLGGLVFLVGAPAAAQEEQSDEEQSDEEQSDEEARSVFSAGEVAFSAGHYADALGYFQRAYTLSERPTLLFNIALCQDRLRDDEAAIASYERYLAEIPLATNRSEVERRLNALRDARARREAAARAVAPTHVAAAATATPNADATGEARPLEPVAPPSERTAFYATWWFWTIVGVVVAGAGIGIGVAVSHDAPLQAGDLGGVVFTLQSIR